MFLEFCDSSGRNRYSLACKKCSPLVYGDYVPVTMYAEGDTVYVDAELSAGQPDVPAVRFKRNELRVHPWNWDINESENAVEVVNENGIPVFQYIRKRPDYIAVTGIFYMPNGRILVADEDRAYFVPKFPSTAPIKAIFKYPSWKYRGVYVDQ